MTATDKDEGVNSEVEYHMYESNNSEALTLFRVDSKSGEIKLARSAHGRGEILYFNDINQFLIL